MAVKKENIIDVAEEIVEEVNVEAQEIPVLTDAEQIQQANERLKERVPYMAFKDDGKYKDDIVVIVNGGNFIIKRGVIVML